VKTEMAERVGGCLLQLYLHRPVFLSSKYRSAEACGRGLLSILRAALPSSLQVARGILNELDLYLKPLTRAD